MDLVQLIQNGLGSIISSSPIFILFSAAIWHLYKELKEEKKEHKETVVECKELTEKQLETICKLTNVLEKYEEAHQNLSNEISDLQFNLKTYTEIVINLKK